jgi:putative ABC transport system permease protein
MDSFIQDLRYGIRTLLKSPGFTAVAVLTLALGIGANTAIFSVVYGVVLRPLPYPQPDRIVQLARTYHGEPEMTSFDYGGFEFWRDHDQVFEYLAGATGVGFDLAGGSEPVHVHGMHVSAEYFQVFGFKPGVGRDFLAKEDRTGGERVAILSNGLWKRCFAADSGLIGRTILLDGEPHTVIGVMPPSFLDVNKTEVWTPLAPVATTIGGGSNIAIMGRLKSGIPPQQVQANLNVLAEDFRRQFPNRMPREVGIGVSNYQELIASDVRKPLFILFGAIAFVLLIACANVANLLLARATGRHKEVAVRATLGATRGRLCQQLLTESILIALIGGALGALLAYWGLDSLLALSPFDLPRASEIRVDRWALGFTILVSLLTGALFGLAPAFQASITDLNEALKEGPGRTTSGVRHWRLRSVLAVGEIAISLILLAGAALLTRTFANLLRTDPGFSPKHILTQEIWTTGLRYSSTARIASFYQSIVERIEGLPGVQAAGVVAAGLPLQRGGNTYIEIRGQASSQGFSADYREITPNLFQAMGIPLHKGRFFSHADSENSDGLAIINEQFARRHFPDRNPLGERLTIDDRVRQIVGVVGDVKSYLNQPAPPTVFIPASQAPYATTRIFDAWFPTHIVVRTAMDPLSLSQSVERELRAVDPDLPIGRVRSMEQVLSMSLAFQRFMMVLLSLFAGLALLLAAVGIYGVLAYSVSQRTHEMGVRMALGAHPGDIFKLVVGQALKWIIVGLAVGVAGAFTLSRVLSSLLYGVTATDLATFVGVSLLLSSVVLLACYFPARRATKVDPMVALRYE